MFLLGFGVYGRDVLGQLEVCLGGVFSWSGEIVWVGGWDARLALDSCVDLKC